MSYAESDSLEPRLGTSVTADIPEGQSTPTVDIRLPESRWLTGQVTDDDGRGVVGAYIAYASGKGDASSEPLFLGSLAVSGADGRFRIPVATGRGTLTFRHMIFGYLPPCSENWAGQKEAMPKTFIEVSETGDLAAVQLRVSRGLAVRGVVRDGQGQLLAGAVVRGQNTVTPFRRTRTLTDAQGRFELSGLSPHVPAKLTVTTLSVTGHQDIPAAPDHPWDRTRRVEDVELVVQPGFALAGRVLHGDRPLAGVRMRLHRMGSQENQYTFFGEAETDAEGRYRVGALAAGDRYYFEIVAPDGMIAPGWVHQMPYVQQIREGSPQVIELPDAVLVAGGQTLRGSVVDPQDRPVAGVTVSASIADARSLSRRENPPTIALRGICLDDSRKPVADAEVRLYAMRFCAENLDLLTTSHTGHDGRFDLGEFPKPGLPGVHIGVVGKPELPKGPTAYQVVLIKKNMAVHIISIPGHKPESIEAVMSPGAKLDGTVVGPDKRPVAGATVYVAGYGGMSDLGVATSDENGRFALPDMTPWQSDIIMTANGAKPASSRTLVVEHRDFGRRQCRFHACPATIDVELAEPSVVEGIVTDAAGHPKPAVQVAAKAAETEQEKASAWATANTDAQGRYRLLLQGIQAIDLYVWDPEFVSTRIKSFPVVPGKTHHAAILRAKPRAHWADE